MTQQVDQKEFENYMLASLVRGRTNDIALGFLIYNLFMISDWFLLPDDYLTIWSIRLSVTLLWIMLIAFHETNFVQKHLHGLYICLLFIALNSTVLFYQIGFQENLPADMTAAAMVLTFCLSAFHIPRRYAFGAGIPYVLGFYALIYFDKNPNEIRFSHTISISVAFIMGIMGATVRERYARRAFLDEKRLREETDRADNLLLRVFPFDVAKELKFNHKSEARYYEHVTVMFCDIANFTEKSASTTPAQLVDWLNHVFSSFDALVNEHRCEKIKTIGDSYMAVCGAPKPVTDHAERIINLSLAIQNKVDDLRLGGEPLRLRIGVSSGPVVAGVIGQSRFAYDLWGDTVNTASRLESLAPVGGILISDLTKTFADETFAFEKVPSLPVKGKGLMDAWIVKSTQTEESKPNINTAA